MLPMDIINKTDEKNETVNGEEVETFEYDEFGFRSEKDESNTNPNGESQDRFVNISLATSINPKIKNLLTSEPLIEDSKHKLKWIAYLEFTLNTDIGSSFSWDQVTSLTRCDKLRVMIRGQGIPHSMRPFIWMRLSGALSKKLNSKFKYAEVLKNFQHDQFHTSKQIEKDLLRTLPTNACFYSSNSVGIPRLRRVLQSIAWLYPSIGYCQGMGTIVASLLLFLEEEDAFWLMCSIVEDILPASYYSHTLLGVQADMKVLRQLIATYLPEIEQQLKKHDIELSLVLINW
jgi:small G protein signaling modulator 3